MKAIVLVLAISLLAVPARLTAAKRMDSLDFPRDVAIGTVPAGKNAILKKN